MPSEFELSPHRQVEIHEAALHAAHAKLYEAQHERVVWATVVNTTKAGEAENNTARQQAMNHGLTIKYMRESIKHHTVELARARADAERADRAAGEAAGPIPFPKTADA